MPNPITAMLQQVRDTAKKGSRARKSAQRKAKAATAQFVSQKKAPWQKPLGVGTSPVLDRKRAEEAKKAAVVAARAAAKAAKVSKTEES